jgi:hypothetical protein
MALNITQSQIKNLGDDWLESTASEYDKLDVKGIDQVLLRRAKAFQTNLIKSINAKKVISTGEMEKNINFYLKHESADETSLLIDLAYYAKFVDKGVKGWKSSKNAPKSPYQYKTKGMSEEGIASVRKMISQGKMKIKVTDVKKYGAVGYEKKNKKQQGSLIDRQTKTAVYMIKKYGIKTRNFISEPLEKTFKGIEVEIGDLVGLQLMINIINK